MKFMHIASASYLLTVVHLLTILHLPTNMVRESSKYTTLAAWVQCVSALLLHLVAGAICFPGTERFTRANMSFLNDYSISVPTMWSMCDCYFAHQTLEASCGLSAAFVAQADCSAPSAPGFGVACWNMTGSRTPLLCGGAFCRSALSSPLA